MLAGHASSLYLLDVAWLPTLVDDGFSRADRIKPLPGSDDDHRPCSGIGGGPGGHSSGRMAVSRASYGVRRRSLPSANLRRLEVWEFTRFALPTRTEEVNLPSQMLAD
jgi:hypothetical protein